MTSAAMERDRLDVAVPEQPSELRPSSAADDRSADLKAAHTGTPDDEVRQGSCSDPSPVPTAATTVTEGGTPVAGTTLSAEELDELRQGIVMALKTVYDHEIPSDIYELGLIYSIDVDDERNVAIDMTLTAPGCPVAGEMPIWVENAVGAVEGVSGVEVSMVFDPPWTPDRMSEEAQVAVGWY